MQQINNTLHQYYRYLLQYFCQNDIIGIFLFGSQNYGIANENSDIDAMALIVENAVPLNYYMQNTIRQQKSIILNTDQLNEHDNHIIIKTIDCFINELIETSDLLNHEILFTPYFLINPKYAQQFSSIQDQNSDIVYYNYNCFLKKQLHQEILNHYQYILNPITDPNQDMVQIFGYTPKKLFHLKRLIELGEKYSQFLPYSTCLQIINSKEMYRLKHYPYGKTIAVSKAKQYYQSYLTLLEQLPIVPRNEFIYNFLKNYTIINDERN